jgi:Gluconate 2-dehydrogenase subunit 3
MNRREALQLLATAAALPLAPRSLLAAMQQARAVVGTQTTLRTLNPRQNATVRAIAELILPRTETPGATDVGTAEFIDLILTEWYEEAEKSRFLTGLAEVDARTQSLFSKDFIECSALQQADCLSAMGEKMAEDVERLHGQPHRTRGGSPAPEAHFYAMLRRLTLTAYYTSEAGATQALNFQVIPDRHDACADVSSNNQKPESH